MPGLMARKLSFKTAVGFYNVIHDNCLVFTYLITRSVLSCSRDIHVRESSEFSSLVQYKMQEVRSDHVHVDPLKREIVENGFTFLRWVFSTLHH